VARAVLTALRVRSVAVLDAAGERILAQKDPSLLGTTQPYPVLR